MLGGIDQDLVTNRFAEAGKVEGHGVVALGGLDIIGGVADAVVGIRVADTLGSTKGFFNYPHLVLPLVCLVSFVSLLCFPHDITSRRLVPSGVTGVLHLSVVGGAGARRVSYLVSLVPSRSSSFWLKMGKGNIWRSRVCMKSVGWNGLF